MLAFLVFFRVLSDAALAARVKHALLGATPEPEKPRLPGRTPPAEPPTHHAPALHLLAILQREGRFVDFLQEDVAGFADADVGAAARVVHDGCRKALKQYVTVEPLASQAEGAPITLEAGFDASRYRLTGNVVGNPPFKGQVKHRGWRATQVSFPPPPQGMDAHVVAPAEVEL
jgi:hypothetical protein